MTKLLIVDDEAGIRQIIKKYAQFEGYEVAEAANGMEAIDYCRENADVDLIVMDYDAGIGRLFRLPGNPQNA